MQVTVDDDQAESIEVGGVGFGTRLTFQGFKLVASGFFNHGLGMQFQGNIDGGYSGSLDERGKARHFYGGYIQGTYDFGQGTNIGYSYGSNHLSYLLVRMMVKSTSVIHLVVAVLLEQTLSKTMLNHTWV